MAFHPGQSAVIIPVPAAEPAVARWRARFDPAAAVGVPAHVTVLYPFLPQDQLTDDVLGELRRLITVHPGRSVTFARAGRFPGVLYLAPDPAGLFRQLTADLVRRWPEAPPYGGAISDPVPHLTITHGAPPATADEAENDVSACLPITAAIDEARLITFDGTSWSGRANFPLAGPTRQAP